MTEKIRRQRNRRKANGPAEKKSDIENKKSSRDQIAYRYRRKNRRWTEGYADLVSDTRRERTVAKDGGVEDKGLRPGEPQKREYMTLQELADWLSISRGSAWSLVIERREICSTGG